MSQSRQMLVYLQQQGKIMKKKHTHTHTHGDRQYLFEVVDLLDVAALGRLQLADVPVLISALLEEGG